MKRKCSLIASIVLLLNGCSSTDSQKPSDQTPIEDYKPAKFDSRGVIVDREMSVTDLKYYYYQSTGKELVANTAGCGNDRDCYNRVFHAAYDEGIKESKRQEREKREKDDSACDVDKKCARNKQIGLNKSQLIGSYEYVLASYPYDQGGADYVVRAVCKNATDAQRSGVRKEDFLNALRDEPGVSPEGRVTGIKIANACWNLSSLGYNWNEALRRAN